ncbi:MAG: metallophosphoesterase [Candidatus Bathyarchaeota archaeon]
MELLILSDLHGDFSAIRRIYEKASKEKITALIICGDITHFGSLAQAEEILKELTELGSPLLFVPGNCDPKELANVQYIHDAANIHGKYKEIEGLVFLGIGGSPYTPFHTPFEMSENEIEKILDDELKSSRVKKGFILISHTPPINTKLDLTVSGVRAGSRAVRKFIEAKKPSLVLCGHIHEANGIDMIGSTLIVNPGPASKGLWAIVNVNGKIKARLSALQ